MAAFTVVGIAGSAVRIDNPTGKIDIHVEMGAEAVRWKASSPTRKVLPQDVQYIIDSTQTQIICHPSDGAEIDLEITAPHTAQLTASTVGGAISLTGLIDLVNCSTLRRSKIWRPSTRA